MKGQTVKNLFLSSTLLVWIIVMGVIVHIHYIKHVDPELQYFAPDILLEGGGREYFSIRKDGQKVGYKSEALVYNPNIITCWENSVIKLNLAGMSREVFIQSAASIDTTQILTKNLDFTIQSGTHFYHCKGLIHEDSLTIAVRNTVNSPWREGAFVVDRNTVFPVALPYFLHRAKRDTTDISVFDPIIFSPYTLHAVRKGKETLIIREKRYETVRYDLQFRDLSASLWLDGDGKTVKSTGYFFFSGMLGDMTGERARDRDVLRLPLEVTLGSDNIRSAAITPDQTIPEPRFTQFLEVQLDGIRAANIDISAPNKRFMSSEPVVFRVYNMPVEKRNRYLNALMNAVNDTTVTGTSDYIQSRDARLIRTARGIAASEADTLVIARNINRWVFERVRKAEGLSIVRSIDVLRDMRGGTDEHTKLFTALTRSIGIPTQINMGFVYIDGAFRYHSWPSVLADGTWYDLDPMLGQDRADATHIALIRGDFDKQAELLRVLGRISIKILDFR